MIGHMLSFYLHDCYLYKCLRGKLESKVYRDIIISLTKWLYVYFLAYHVETWNLYWLQL